MVKSFNVMLITVILQMAPHFPGRINLVVGVPVYHKRYADVNQEELDEEKYAKWETSGHFEGDMVLNYQQRNGVIDEKSRWPNRTIPYELDLIFSEEEADYIKKSLQVYKEKTCLIVRERLPEDEDYIYVTGEDTGCWSNVGYQGGRQELNLERREVGKGCFRNGTIVHEFLHAAGFYHQQSSHERDDFIRIIWENIKPGNENNFNKHSAADVSPFNTSYDYQSIMHYGPYAFSANDKRTIVTLNPLADIGQRLYMSEGDAYKVNRMYCPKQT